MGNPRQNYGELPPSDFESSWKYCDILFFKCSNIRLIYMGAPHPYIYFYLDLIWIVGIEYPLSHYPNLEK